MVNNVITPGDIASGHLMSSSGNKATGVVTKTTDSRDTPVGAITFILDPSTDTIEASGIAPLCGPHASSGYCGA
jgi:hypothetical protein